MSRLLLLVLLATILTAHPTYEYAWRVPIVSPIGRALAIVAAIGMWLVVIWEVVRLVLERRRHG